MMQNDICHIALPESEISGEGLMGIVENVDPDGLLEYSVVFTDRSLNSMCPNPFNRSCAISRLG